MQMTLYVLLGLALTWIAYLAYLWIASKALQGSRIDHLSAKIPELANFPRAAMLYCYSPRCGPCRSMSPLIDQLRAEGRPIIKLDIGEDVQLARELGVRAAPTLILLRKNVIQQVQIGARSRAQIERMLQQG